MGKHISIKSLTRKILLALVVIYVIAGVYLYLNQRKFLYRPQPGVLQITEQQVEILVNKIILRGWVVNRIKSDAIIYFGGNAERPEASLEDFKYLFNNQAVYMINYRGYGESEGLPSEKHLCLDAVAIYDRIAGDHDHISVIGRSLGSGVAVYLATERDVHRLVLVTPYDCMAQIAQSIFPIFPVKLLITDPYNSAQRVQDITTPTLIIKAENDEVIPSESTDDLVTHFSLITPQVATVHNATHNDIQLYPGYHMLLRDFVTGTDE
ncbi:MAG: alpha/beta hydrolase [Candidatus Sabulitectum sp.]|nr:alpha/beta hydrolase [Candidatus Sabulitectum sp.]